MSGQVLTELETKYQEEKNKRPTLSFAAFIAESALMELEHRRLIREAASISLVGLFDNTITLKDARNKERFVEVQIKEKSIKCLADNVDSCIHVGFALALPEVRKILKDRGISQ